jgi:hypothetical protein
METRRSLFADSRAGRRRQARRRAGVFRDMLALVRNNLRKRRRI